MYKISLPGIERITDAVLEDQLTENLTSLFDWGLLNVGAFINVKRTSTNSIFKPSNIPGVATGKVWESPKSNWVWESGIDYSHQPIVPSGIYINNNFVPDGSGYYLNFRDSQIVFNTPLSPASSVKMEYSYRMFNFYDAEADWFQQVIFDPLPPSGTREILARNRIYLPAIIVEIPPNSAMVPYQLGDYSVIENKNVLFHILAERDEERNKIVYILERMFGHTIYLYDVNKIADANKFQFDDSGKLSSGVMTYPQLVENFMWKRCTFANIMPQDVNPKLPFFRAVVRVTLQILMP